MKTNPRYGPAFYLVMTVLFLALFVLNVCTHGSAGLISTEASPCHGLHRLMGLVRGAISTGNGDHRPVPAHLTSAVVGRANPTARAPADGHRVAAAGHEETAHQPSPRAHFARHFGIEGG